mmetsp:Transcript_19679/g.27140  ORF Transcript_19679/g.27140 Transcript_19679/m.27140 type:complete len:123 (-) Transcript_19679:171-539(-)|eukprot:CAMPEP_0201474946 /NCGR_PEP_ID=MMETSP0151_2-20130828/441_1 /ASSEMBLY_ACC=CAM_ASM_000257 /TAXON_ID=200890 /ORGANISM="Paramoeba atlantica, Strain 621/1 / CCAP 1560/9" /LENGTH=122 /DNA_ID=CAMNT_0047854911 /DNA_START=44 /DNA_END=412 /DNA_ORIENTATION=-
MADDKKRDASAGAISGKTGVTLVKYNPETGVMEAQRMKRKSPWEKFKENPLIPIGGLATCGVLGGGMYFLRKGDSMNQQYAMRARVAAQAITVAALYYGFVMRGRQSDNATEEARQELRKLD